MTEVEAFVPAKVNLTLHVTGRRADGYHNIDSLAVFADLGDHITITMPGDYRLSVEGPMKNGVPVDESNLVLRAARMMNIRADFRLEKHLPSAAGLGGGSGDAAAVLRVMSGFSGRPIPETAIELGADLPLCLHGASARVSGIGDEVTPVPSLPSLPAVLVNPNQPVMTAEVFERLETRANPAMPQDLPAFSDSADLVAWLREMRNDLQAPAIAIEPVISQILETLEKTPGCQLARMSGSGGTCFGIYQDTETAAAAAGRLAETFPAWWVADTVLNLPKRFSRSLS